MIGLLNIITLVLTASLQFNALSPDATGINTEAICQDDSGNMWFGGIDGITCYDGTRFTVFRNDINDDNSIQDNRIYKLLCSSDGRIWAAHISGLSVFDREIGSFRNFRAPAGMITDIVELPGNLFLTVSGKKLWIFDVSEEKFSRDGLPEILSDFPARTLHASDGIIFIGSEDGRIVTTSARLDRISEVPENLGRERINVIYADGPCHIWAGTENFGLWSIPLDGGKAKQYTSSTYEGSLSFNSVRAICQDTEGRLWVGTKNGLNIFDGERFDVYSHNYYESRSITHNSIHEIFRDRQGTMWLGTYFGGVCFCTSHSSPFVSIFSKPGDNGLKGNVISDITEDHDGSLWIGTNSEGLNHMLRDGRFEHIRSLSGNSPEPVDIKCIWISPRNGDIYIGSDAARLSVFDRKAKKINVLGPDAPRDCYAIEDNRQGGFFVGSTSGLFEYDESRGTFSKVLLVGDITNIKSLEYDSKGVLWIGKKFGVTALEWESGKILELPEVMSSGVRYVEDIFEDSAGIIWLCSDSTLLRYDRQSGDVNSFSAKDGLPDNTIHGIEEDAYGNFWVSTNKGLCRFNPTTGEKWTFSVSDGLPGDRFTAYAHCFTSEGEMYFGGLVGLVHFNPDAISRFCEPVSPVISEVELSGRTLHPTGSVELKPNERDIRIVFSAPDYISGQNGHFSYKMEGMNDDWHTAGMDRTAVYHSLKNGRYTFLLDYRNSSGQKNEEPCRLEIIVQAHWWETLAAKSICACLILFSIILFIWWLISKKENEYKSEMEKARNELLRDFSLEFVGIGADKSAPDKSSVANVFDKGDEAFMRKSMTVVKKNIDNPNFSVEDFATEMNISKSGLHTRVKALFGVSPLKFIKTVRFNEACRLILERKHSFAEIGYMVGFASPSYFASAFHNFIGCTPTEYLAKMKNARRDNPTGGDI